jgi:hypothetical protein
MELQWYHSENNVQILQATMNQAFEIFTYHAACSYCIIAGGHVLLRQSVTGFSPCLPRFVLMSLYLGFVMALGQLHIHLCVIRGMDNGLVNGCSSTETVSHYRKNNNYSRLNFCLPTRAVFLTECQLTFQRYVLPPSSGR